MSYTFISYSRKQLYFAESVVLSLQRAGVQVWFDLQKLGPGIEWSAALKDGYENCERLVLIASQSALESPYVKVEWETALDHGREVIVVLSEAVQLPERLQKCAIYDARARFDESIRDLAAYLNGKSPARYDPHPVVAKSLLKQKMPVTIWLTASIFCIPTITVWLLTLLLPLASISPESVSIELPELIQNLLPEGILIRALAYLVGFLVGLGLAQTSFPVKDLLQHALSFEELKRIRSGLLKFWFGALVIFLGVIYFGPGLSGPLFYSIGAWVSVFFLLTIYWSFWMLPKSADILRWLPAGEADQDLRESVQAAAIVNGREQASRNGGGARRTFSYALHYHPADARIAQTIDSILKQAGCDSLEAGKADVQFILVSNRTSKKWLLEQNASLPGRVINILTTNIHTPQEIHTVLQTQWVDYRNGREKIVQALASEIGDVSDSDESYALQVSPTSFNNSYGFPRSVRIFFGALILLLAVFLMILEQLLQLPEWAFFPLSLPIILYMDALIMRRWPLPGFLQRIFGRRLAWFAAPAEKSSDPIGNSDRSFVTDRKFLLLVDVPQDD